MRVTSPLIAAVALVGALMSSGLALAQAVSTGDAVADPVDAGARAGVNFTLGAGAGMAPDYEGSDDYEFVPLWNLRAGNLYHPSTFVQVLGPRLRSNFLPSDHWRLGLSGQFIRERDDVDNNQVDDLEKVDPSVMLGAVGGYDFFADPREHLALEVDVRQDVANDNGFLASVRGLYGRPFAERWRFDTVVGSTWASDDYMSSYFGIDAQDAARSGLDEYNADEGFKDVSVAGALSYRLFDRWSVTALASYTRLIDDAEDSPVVKDVGDENQFFAGALVNYTF
jgi:outer membrane scaffolding protein for murein synthesis (MipA/OmpV family)